MVTIKTKMETMPNSCKECQYSYRSFGVYLCPLLKNWLEKWEMHEGKLKLDDCPLEEA